MLLTIDIGNTNIVFAVYDGEQQRFESRMDTDVKRMPDQYAVYLSEIMRMNRLHTQVVTESIISSVVPLAVQPLVSAVKKLFGTDSLIVGPGVKNGLNIRIDDPSSVGGDLVSACVAAKAKYPLPLIVADLGTATKILAVDGGGNFIGGALYPGVRVCSESLSGSTALLPSITAEGTVKAIEAETAACMKSGIILGTAAMLDGMISRMDKELGGIKTAVITGGHAAVILPHCETKFVHDGTLVSYGLKIINDKNR
ncbi:MAG: type III pantothenate kinase [Oscillospiraceae bacterium]|jgi:type III pantothenate kinase|nr:type III pantothenate kinase [Oscillospiraceae bacterium]